MSKYQDRSRGCAAAAPPDADLWVVYGVNKGDIGLSWRTNEYWSPHVAFYVWAHSVLETIS